MSMFDQWDFYWDEMPDALAELRADEARAVRDDDAWHADEDRYDEQRPAARGVLDD